MSRETWATFSVKDHCSEYAFVREVMLYDRLVIPIPPDAEDGIYRGKVTVNDVPIPGVLLTSITP